MKGHPKRYKLEDALGTEHGLHYIHLWFCYVAEYAQDGELDHMTKREIARACEWSGDPGVFYDALMAAGFIEFVDGRLVAHDWYEENARFIKENKKRKQPKEDPQMTLGKPVLQDSTIQDSTKPSTPAQVEECYNL